MKSCSKCGQKKSLDEFYNDRNSRDGKTSNCKPCAKAGAKSWRQSSYGRERERLRDAYREGRAEPVRVKRVLSLGAGVQSTAVALMSLSGELPPIDAAIFSDTGWEPQSVYRHLWTVLAPAFTDAGVPLVVVSAGDIQTEAHDPEGRLTMPAFLRKRINNKVVMIQRQCTRKYKIEPIERALRQVCGIPPRTQPRGLHAEVVIGISWDESQRMRDPSHEWIRNSYPLVDARMTRDDCISWLAQREIVAPKSACVCCPYRNDQGWIELKSRDKTAWAQAVAFDRAIRDSTNDYRQRSYLHRKCLPLDQVEFVSSSVSVTLADADCEGMCGL